MTRITGRIKMNVLKRKMVRLLGRIPCYVPWRVKPLLKPFVGLYSKIYSSVYSSIKEEELVKTPMGPYIYVRWGDCVERGCALGTWERKYMDLFCSKIKKGDVVLDVGAYIGIYSLLASERVGSTGCIYAFEPVPRNYERLMRNIEVNQAKNIKAYNFGLSDEDASLALSVPRDLPAESTLATMSAREVKWGISVQKDRIEAKLIPFDEFCKGEGLSLVDIVKVDVDGAEVKVLKGMKNTLSKSKNVVLFVEVNPLMEMLLNSSVRELIELLLSCGFRTILPIQSDSRVGIPLNISDLVNISDLDIYFGNGGNYIVEK